MKTLKSKLTILILLTTCLMLALHLSAAAEMTTVELDSINTLIGEQKYLDWEDITLNPSSTLSDTIDWLESYIEDEVGYRETLISHALYWLDLLEKSSEDTATADELIDWNEIILAEWERLDAPQTQLDYYLDRLSYDAERMQMLIEFLKEEGLDAEIRASYEKELKELQAESSDLNQTMISEKDKLTNMVDGSLSQLNVDLTGQSTTFEKIWEKVEPVIKAENNRLTAAENPYTDGSSEIKVRVINKTQFAISVIENGKPLSGAKVSIWPYQEGKFSPQDAKDVQTKDSDSEGAAVFRLADFKPGKDEKVIVTFRVEKAGYRLHEYEKVKIAGARAVKIAMVKDNGDPYLSMASWNGRDMFSEKNSIFLSSKNNTLQILRLRMIDPKGSSQRVRMYQGQTSKFLDKTIASGEVATFSDPTWMKSMYDGYTLDFYIGEPGWTYKYKTLLLVKKGYVEEPSTTSKVYKIIQNLLHLPMPMKFPIFSDGKIDLGFLGDQVKVNIDLTGTLTISVSPKKLSSKSEALDWQTADQIALDDYVKEFDAKSNLQKANMNLGILDQTISNRDKNLLGSSKASIKFMAEAQLKYDEKKDRFNGKISAGVAVSYKFELTKTVFIWAIPVYFGFDFTASAGITLYSEVSCNGDFGDWKWDGVKLLFTVKFELGVSAGVGVKGIASIGLRGYGYLKMELWLIGTDQSMFTAGAGVNVEFVFLFYSKSTELWADSETRPIDTSKPSQNEESLLSTASNTDFGDPGFTGMEEIPLVEPETKFFDIDTILDTIPESDSPKVGLKPDKEFIVAEELDPIGNTLKNIHVSAGHEGQYHETDYTFYISNHSVDVGKVRPRLKYKNARDKSTVISRIAFKDCDKAGDKCTPYQDNTDLYHYSFDIDVKSWNGKPWAIITLVAGTRNGLIPNPKTEAEVQENLIRAGEQTGVYSIVLEFSDVNSNDIEVLTWDIHCIYKAQQGERISLPRARAVGETIVGGGGKFNFVSAYYLESGLRSGTKSYAIPETYVGEKNIDGDNGYLYYSTTDPVIDYVLTDTTVSINGEGGGFYYPALGAVLTRNAENPANNTILITAMDKLNDKNTVREPLKKITGTYSAISRLDVRDMNGGCDYTRGFAFLKGTLSGSKDSQAKTNLVLASLSGSKVNKRAYYSDLVLTVKETNLNIGTDQFKTVSLVNKENKPAAAVYLYWAQSFEEKDVKTGKITFKNGIRASLLDLKNVMATPAFTLLETKNLPTNIYLDRLRSFYEGDRYSFGFYTLQEKVNGETHTHMMCVHYKSAAAISLLGASTEDPVAGIGDTMNFLISLRNDGNLVVDTARLQIDRIDKQAGTVYIDIDFKHPEKNSMEYWDQAGNKIYTTDKFSIYEIPSMTDSIFPDEMISDVTITQANGEGLVTSEPEEHSDYLGGILPGQVGTFKGQIENVPATWEGSARLRTTLAKITSSPNLQTKEDTLRTAAGKGSTESGLEFSDIVYIEYEMAVDEEGTCTACTATKTKADGRSETDDCSEYADYRYMTDEASGRTRMDQIELHTAANDLDIDVSTFDDNDTPMVSIAVTNSNGYRTNDRSTVSAVLDAEDADTSSEFSAFSHTFQQPLTESYGYDLIMPLSELTKGRPYEEIQLKIAGAGDDFDEWNEYNNEDIIEALANVEFISQPHSVEVPQGTQATFSINARGYAGLNPEPSSQNSASKDAEVLTYQWQYRDLNNEWHNVEGATSNTLTLNNVDISMNGYVYWCIVYDSTGAGRMSDTATLIVNNKRPNPFKPLDFFPLFSGSSRLPATGFSTLSVTRLSKMPASIQYAPTGLSIMIPSINLISDLKTVPVVDGEFIVEWLDMDSGLLEGSAMPGEGVSFITGHNHLNTLEAGPFALLSAVKEGDRIFIIDAQQTVQQFKVTSSQKIASDNFETLTQIASMDEKSLNLLTCEDELAEGGYANRRLVSAVPVDR